LAIRQLAITGDLFIKVVQTVDKSQVYFQLIDAEYVIDPIRKDHRDYITHIRVDTPQMDDKGKAWTYTEVWDKETQSLRIWRHSRGDASIADLGTPSEEVPFSAYDIDFVPFVHVAFRDIGEDRGSAAITPALDKIDEANRIATRLHQMLFRYNRPLWALSAGMMDASGRPVPAPILGSEAATDTLTLHDDTLLRLPGMASISSLVPNVNYADALVILQDMMGELENDLPELAYYSIRQMGNPSGRAIRLLLSDAIDRLLEVRGNAESGLIQADMMALTMMSNAGMGIQGSFEQGDFLHTFAERDVIAIDGLEQAQEELAQAQAYKTWREGGMPDAVALARIPGYSDEDIAGIIEMATAEVEPDGETIPEGER
jgi:hypothetical protein